MDTEGADPASDDPVAVNEADREDEGAGRGRHLALTIRGNGVMARAVMLATVPVIAAGILVELAMQLGSASVVANEQLQPIAVSMPWLAVLGGLAIVSMVAVTAGSVAAGRLAVRLRLGRDASARWAVGSAWRCWPTLLALDVLGLILVALPVAAGYGVLRLVPVWWLALPAALIVLVVEFLPVSLVWSVVVVEGRGVFGALRRARRLATELQPVFAVKVIAARLVPVLVALGVLTGLDRLMSALLPPWPAAAVTSALAWIVGVAWLAATAAVRVGVLLRGHRIGRPGPRPATGFAYWDVIDAAALNRVLNDGDRWVPPARRRSAWVARLAGLVLGLLLPGMLSTGLPWWNPLRAPAYSSVETGADWPADPDTITALPDGSAAVTDIDTVNSTLVVAHCTDTGCHSRSGHLGLAGTSAAVSAHGRLAVAGWRSVDGEHYGDLRLVTCRLEDCTTAALRRARRSAPVLYRYRSHSHYGYDQLYDDEIATAIARDADGYLVAAIHAGRGDTAPVTLYRCMDQRCAHPDVMATGALPQHYLSLRNRALSLSVRDGRAALAVLNRASGAVRLMTADIRRGHQRLTTTVLATASEPRPTHTTSWRAAARVVQLPNGVPMVAYRDAATGAVRVVACSDVTCAVRSVRAVTGPGWGHPAPGLVLDAGRAVLASYDLPHRRLVLVACQDQSCRRTTQVALAGFDHWPGAVGLALDTAGRPVVVWTDQDDSGATVTRVLHCTAARCG